MLTLFNEIDIAVTIAQLQAKRYTSLQGRLIFVSFNFFVYKLSVSAAYFGIAWALNSVLDGLEHGKLSIHNVTLFKIPLFLHIMAIFSKKEWRLPVSISWPQQFYCKCDNFLHSVNNNIFPIAHG